MKYILALDQGTTSSRAIIFDHHGAIVACAQREFTQIFPQPGWVEHDPLEIWQGQLTVVHEAMSLAGISNDNIAAIGITNQRETTVVWERATGKPIYNAIVWQDRRTASMCDLLKHDGFEPLFSGKTGLVLDPYFSGTKIRWILDHVPSAREKAMRGELAFGTIDSWLIWNLTGGAHLSDASNASRTLLYNIHTNSWDDKLLGMLGIPRSVLPEVCASSEVVANTKDSIFGRPVPIAGIAGDQQAALFGQRCTMPGMVKNTYGTGCFMLMHTGEHAVHSKNKLLTTVAWKINNQVEYALEGSVFVAGATMQWLRDGLQIIRSAAESEALAHSVVDNGGVYFVPAFSGLGAPHWDANTRGTIVGITRGTTSAHIVRAGLEAIAYQNAEVLDAMRADSDIALSELRVDGGATQNNFLMQFQADVLEVPVALAETQEATALGAAYLAGLGVGYWQTTEEIDAIWKVKQRFEPRMDSETVQALRHKWAKAVECARSWGSDQ